MVILPSETYWYQSRHTLSFDIGINHPKPGSGRRSQFFRTLNVVDAVNPAPELEIAPSGSLCDKGFFVASTSTRHSMNATLRSYLVVHPPTISVRYQKSDQRTKLRRVQIIRSTIPINESRRRAGRMVGAPAFGPCEYSGAGPPYNTRSRYCGTAGRELQAHAEEAE